MPVAPETPMISPEKLKQFDESQETDQWWGAYSGRAMLPRFAVSAVVALLIGLITWLIWDEHQTNPLLMWHTAVAVVFLYCLVPFVTGIHRTTSWNYRLTTRRLLRDRGFGRPAAGEIALTHVTSVQVEADAWERWLDIGRIRVETGDAKALLVLEGVRHPNRVADLIRDTIDMARDHCPPAPPDRGSIA